MREAYWYTNETGIVEVSSLPCSDKKLVIIERAPWLPRTWRFQPLPGQELKQTFKLWKGKPTRIRHELKPRRITETLGFEAIYHVETRDTLERLAEYFCYRNVDELATANKLPKPYKIYQDQPLRLSGWQFFQTKSADLFEKLDAQFGLPKGWSRPAQRTLHDDPKRAYEHEIVAIPTQEFVRTHKPKKML